jgi:phospholipid/cholesterol/gamma-HCH transport system ATP-binding protein
VSGAAVIDVRGLATRFGSLVLHEALDLEIRRGEVVALVGGSGSGKTTLLREIIMLQRPSAGAIHLFGEDVVGIGEAAAQRLRRRFGVLFQMGALFSSLTVLENVMVPLREHTDLPPRQIAELGALKMALAGLPIHAADKLPRQLSGGMIKRASLARALALDPELLFLDEPTAGLDPISAGALDELVLQLRESLGLTVVMVTHDLDSLWRITDRVAFLGERRVLGLAPMRELVRDPSPQIRDYFDSPRARAAATAYRTV